MGETRKITYKELIDAIEQNGYRRSNGHFIQFKEGTKEVYAACAVGQGLLNLGVKPEHVDQAANFLYGLSDIYTLNDSKKYDVKRIAKEAKQRDAYIDDSYSYFIPESYFEK